MNIYRKYLFNNPPIYSTPHLQQTYLKNLNQPSNERLYRHLYTNLYKDLYIDLSSNTNKLTIFNTIVISLGLIGLSVWSIKKYY